MRKFRIPYIPYRSLLLSTTVLNDRWVMDSCMYIVREIFSYYEVMDNNVLKFVFLYSNDLYQHQSNGC